MIRFINPLELLYYLGYSFKKKCLLIRQKKLPCKVISIGNITVGGTGKTPTTIAVAQRAKKKGLKPIILTRGYKGKAKGPVFVNFLPLGCEYLDLIRGERFVDKLGDEAFMISQKLRDVPLVKFSDRYKAGILAFNILKHYLRKEEIVFILDDGFQHWGLYRDIDIVLIDGADPFGNGKLFPLGKLREFPEGLKRADVIVISKTENEQLETFIKKINPQIPLFHSTIKIKALRRIDGSYITTDSLVNKRLYAFCGLARPQSFNDTLALLRAHIAHFKKFPDHYIYREKDIINLIKHSEKLRCDYIVTTEKDKVKIEDFESARKILYIEIEMSIPEDFYDIIFNNNLPVHHT
ncbi:MAG: tetraacyldisaccharide 4'-kinase [Thermodesulfovibrionales bacterium]|nr:tetraacyldisaccharide 4'-kinase [Thermodesulfovibrionales bacterium]